MFDYAALLSSTALYLPTFLHHYEYVHISVDYPGLAVWLDSAQNVIKTTEKIKVAYHLKRRG
jgi:hypothetical protein